MSPWTLNIYEFHIIIACMCKIHFNIINLLVGYIVTRNPLKSGDFVTCWKMLIFLQPLITKFEDHPLSSVRNYLFDIIVNVNFDDGDGEDLQNVRVERNND